MEDSIDNLSGIENINNSLTDNSFEDPVLVAVTSPDPVDTSNNIENLRRGSIAYEETHHTPVYWWGKIPDGLGEIKHKPTIVSEFDNKIIVQVSARAQNALFLSDTGDVYMCGEGFTDEKLYEKPQLLNSFILEKALKGIRINYVCCGMSHALALTEDGKVYSWGSNNSGELGHGKNNLINNNKPEIVKGILSNKTIRRIGCGAEFSIAISDRGNVYSWGNGKYGVLGLGNEINKYTPCEINDFHVLLPCMISCGWSFTVLVDGSGNVYTWGRGSEGQCGDGDLNNNLTPKYIDLLFSKESSQNIIGVACGYFHCLALNGEGVVYSWGLGNNGQLGLDFLSDLEFNSNDFYHPLPTRIKLEKEIKMISAGSFHSLLVSKENEIYLCGKNDNKQLIHYNNNDIIWTPEELKLNECLSNEEQVEMENLSIYSVSSGLEYNILVTKRKDDIDDINNSNNNTVTRQRTFSDYLSASSSNNINYAMMKLPSLRAIKKQYLLYSQIPLKNNPFNTKNSNSGSNNNNNNNLNQMEIDYNMWKEIIEYWSIKKNDKKVKQLFTKGIPPHLRSMVYPIVIGNHLQITPSLYEMLKERLATSRKLESLLNKMKKSDNLDIIIDDDDDGDDNSAVMNENSGGSGSESNDKKKLETSSTEDYTSNDEYNSRSYNKSSISFVSDDSIRLIRSDLPRTFPYLSYFGDNQPLYNQMKEMLEIFVCYRPDIGYVQGMSYIAGMLCLYCLNDSYILFQCFSNLLLNRHMFGFLRLESKILEYYWDAFKIALKNKNKILSEHLEEIDLSPGMYLLQWMETLFLQCLPFELACRIFDGYIYEGTSYLYKTALCILELLSPELIDQPLDVCAQILTSSPGTFKIWSKYVNEDNLIPKIMKCSLPNSVNQMLDSLCQDVYVFKESD